MALITNLTAASASQSPKISERTPFYRRSRAAFLRASNTTTYTVGDVVTTTATAAIEFPMCADVLGGGGLLVSATLVIDDLVTPTADFELLLFDAEPTNAADNDVIALVDTDAVKLVAILEFASQIVTGADQVAYKANVLTAVEQVFVCTDSTRSLYGLLVNRLASYADPEASAPITITLGIRAD